MENKIKVSGKAMSLPGGLALGAAVSMTITVLCCILLSRLVDLEIIPWETIGYGIMGMMVISAFTGAQIAAVKIKHQKLIVCISSGLIYWGLLLCITALFFGGQYESVILSGSLILAGSICAAVINVQLRKGSLTKKHKISR